MLDFRFMGLTLCAWIVVAGAIKGITPWPCLVSSIVAMCCVLVHILQKLYVGSTRFQYVIQYPHLAQVFQSAAVSALWSAAAYLRVQKQKAWNETLPASTRVRFIGHKARASESQQSVTLLRDRAVLSAEVKNTLLSDNRAEMPQKSSVSSSLEIPYGSQLQVRMGVKESGYEQSSTEGFDAEYQLYRIESISDPESIWSVVSKARDLFRDNISHLSPESGALFSGMVFGDVSAQTPQMKYQFIASGLSHLTAVSGANIAMVTGVIAAILSFLGAKKRTQLCAGIATIIIFVFLVGPEPSVFRAALMGLMGMTLIISGKRGQSTAVLCMSVLSLLLFQPELSVTYSLLLSVAASLGIIIFTPMLCRYLQRCYEHRTGKTLRVWQVLCLTTVSVSIVADCVTAPIIVCMTGVISPWSILANTAVAPVVPLITALGVLCLGTGVLPVVPTFIASCAKPLLFLIQTVAALCAELPVIGLWSGLTSGVLCGLGVGCVVTLSVKGSYALRKSALILLPFVLLIFIKNSALIPSRHVSFHTGAAYEESESRWSTGYIKPVRIGKYSDVKPQESERGVHFPPIPPKSGRLKE